MSQFHNLIREIQGIAQTGLHYTKDPYDEERFQRLRDISFELMSLTSDLPLATFAKFFLPDSGYATPKVDLRACIFKNDQVLLVQERSDQKWTLPGGWADQNEPPTAGIIREVREESGYDVAIDKLYAIKDRGTNLYRPVHPFTTYKLFFLGTIIGGAPLENVEIAAIDFFPLDRLPPLSIDRTLPEDIHLAWQHRQNPALLPHID